MFYLRNSGNFRYLKPNNILSYTLTFLSICVIGWIIIRMITLYYEDSSSHLVLIAFSLILGGAIGNLIDRIRLGAVVDFIDVGWWPVFNLADSSIVVGLCILAFILLTNRITNERNRQEVDEDLVQ